MKLAIWIAFALLVAAQWFVPVSLITKSERTLVDGTEFRFRTQPVDPSDPFRGKYITLSFEAANIMVRDTAQHQYEPGEDVFASIVLDSAGFAVVDSLYTEDPRDESLTMLKSKVNYAYMEADGGQSVQIDFPFERLYLEESKASEAERVYWQNQRFVTDSTTAIKSYAVVRIRDAHAVLVDVMINDRSIVDIVREINEKEAVKQDTIPGF
jgi:uncharacterized membrane-anchored protein